MTAQLDTTVEARLRGAGQRYTEQRRDLVRLLADAASPRSIPQILAEAGDMKQSSAYRNLASLEHAGVVRRVPTDEEYGRYELAEDLIGHHHHLVCSNCGTMRDVEVPGLGDRGPRMLSKQALAGVIEPRVEEIFSLVQQVIRESGYEEVLSSGIVITGWENRALPLT